MSKANSYSLVPRRKIKFVLPFLILLGVLLFILAYLGIQKSRSDSLQLLRQQGTALLESLTLSADNAIKANSFFDLLIHEKYSDLAVFLESHPDLDFTPAELADFSLGYGVDAILIFNSDGGLKCAGSRSVFINIEDIRNTILPEVEALIEDDARINDLLTVFGELPGDVSMYYLGQTSDKENVIVIVSDALFYSEAKRNIGIGYLVQNIAREVGIDYIIFQTDEGIVFSSRKLGPLLKIEKDPFLKQALDNDSTISRKYLFADREILELVRPFSSEEYGDGLFRLGLSLDKYNEIVAGFDRQMIALSVVIFAVFVLAVLYLEGKQKRLYLDRSYQEMKSLSEKVFDSINSGVISVRKDGFVELANRRFLEDFGLAENDLVGTSWDRVSFKEIIPFNTFLSGDKGSDEYKTEFRSPAGHKYYLVNITRLYDYENKPAGAVAVVYDYTQIKELENTARRKERLTELGDLAAGVAHEIRNPLNAISIAAQRLMAEFKPEREADEFESFTRQIKSEANRLNDIVTRFLALAREKAESRKKINFSRAVSETLDLLKLDSDKADIVLEYAVEPDILLLASEDRIKQLVINLVRNAVEACIPNEGKIIVNLEKKDNNAILLVADNGPGIPPELRDKIFNPYFSTKDKGTGLGLSIVHQIVDEFNGRLELSSSPGKGTQFRISFPV